MASLTPYAIIILVIMTTTSCQQQRDDNVAERVTKIEEKLDKLIKVVDNVARRQNNDSQRQKSGGQSLAASAVNGGGLKFMGIGVRITSDEHVNKFDTSLGECIRWCSEKRVREGIEWNCFIWKSTNGHCECDKNATGHDESDTWVREYIHFEFA